MSDLADRLEVKVIAARDLVEAEGGECNPFAVVKCNMLEQTMVKKSRFVSVRKY
jgi:hypothetical protein